MEQFSFDEVVISPDSSFIGIGSIFLIILESLVGVDEIVVDQVLA